MASYCSLVVLRSVTSAMTPMSSLLVSSPPSTFPSAPPRPAADHREPSDPLDRAAAHQRHAGGADRPGRAAAGRAAQRVLRRLARRYGPLRAVLRLLARRP